MFEPKRTEGNETTPNLTPDLEIKNMLHNKIYGNYAVDSAATFSTLENYAAASTAYFTAIFNYAVDSTA